MQPEPSSSSPTSTEAASLQALDQAGADLIAVGAQLKEARKVLLRDWEALTPKERSAGSRIVKALESRQRELQEFLDMHRHRLES